MKKIIILFALTAIIFISGCVQNSGVECNVASDCKGALPSLCQVCSNNVSGCAHFECNNNKCETVFCPESNSLSEKCTSTGGTVSTAMCCLSSGDFPRMDLIGACGCSSDNSHEVKICDCGEKVWNGETCISR